MDNSQALAAAPRNKGMVPRAQDALGRLMGVTDQPALRRALPAIALLLAAAVALAAWLVLSPQKTVTLNAGMPEAETARALDLLTAQGFGAALDPRTGALTVGASEYHRARLALAAEGLPATAPEGLSLIADMPMGTSRSVEGARLRRMQELDLARSIAEIQAVKAARVHLALPERSAFVRDARPPGASVVLQLARGGALSEAQVQAIISLVAAAVPNMPRGNVSVVDQTGRLLTDGDEDPLFARADRQMQHRMQMERLLRQRIETLITPIVGPGNAAVEVTMDMDFTRSEITREDFIPDATALRSEQQSVEQRSGQAVGGIPGAISNTPPPEGELVEKPGQQEPAQTADRSSSSTRNYEVSRRVETTAPPSATVRRISAAVLLRLPPSVDPAQPGALSDETLADIEALTRSAIGFDEARGDAVTVTASAFVEPQALAAPAWYEAAWLPDAGRILAQIAIFAIIVLGVVRPLLQRLLAQPSEGDNRELMALGDAIEVPEGETLGALRARIAEMPVDRDDLDGTLDYSEKVALLRHMATQETGKIAGAFQSMLRADAEAEK